MRLSGVICQLGGITSGLPVIGQNPDQTPRGPECYCPFTTITAEVVSFTLVAEDEGLWKRWPFIKKENSY